MPGKDPKVSPWNSKNIAKQTSYNTFLNFQGLALDALDAQARMRGIGAQSRLFGIKSKINNGRFRAGWSHGTGGKLNFRIGKGGSHKAFFGYKFNTSYKFYNVMKKVYK